MSVLYTVLAAHIHPSHPTHPMRHIHAIYLSISIYLLSGVSDQTHQPNPQTGAQPSASNLFRISYFVSGARLLLFSLSRLISPSLRAGSILNSGPNSILLRSSWGRPAGAEQSRSPLRMILPS